MDQPNYSYRGCRMPEPGEIIQVEGEVATWEFENDTDRMTFTFRNVHTMKITRENPDPKLVRIIERHMRESHDRAVLLARAIEKEWIKKR